MEAFQDLKDSLLPQTVILCKIHYRYGEGAHTSRIYPIFPSMSMGHRDMIGQDDIVALADRDDKKQ
jgi:hypothetical protein